MPILITLFRAIVWVALPAIGAACAGVYCSEHARRDLAQEAARKALPDAAQRAAQKAQEAMPGSARHAAPSAAQKEKQPVAPGVPSRNA